LKTCKLFYQVTCFSSLISIAYVFFRDD